MMKKIFNPLIAVLVLVFSTIVPFETVEAKTINDLRRELNELERRYEENVKEQKLTEKEYQRIENEVRDIQSEIADVGERINRTKVEITNLEHEITVIEEDISNIVKQYQLTSSNMDYFDYIFSATDYTEFIHRAAVIEALTEHNQKLLDEAKSLIDQNYEMAAKLTAERNNLKVKNQEMSYKLATLGKRKTQLVDVFIDIKEDLKAAREILTLYESLGCKPNEDVDKCASEKIPAATSLYRPVQKGYITSPHGYRTDPLTGKRKFHAAVDIGYRYQRQTIYAAANGRVAGVLNANIKKLYEDYKAKYPNKDNPYKDYTCGGIGVLIHHRYNNKTYTSFYLHLQVAYVKKGDLVTFNTPIGVMGGDWTTPWDRCSTGMHLHFGISRGLYGIDLPNFSDVQSPDNSINPTTLITFPKNVNHGGSWGWDTR